MDKFSENEPLIVSIKCITYNHEAYIRQCLEGFVMQKTNFRYEAIVHDDASTDATATIIREYAEKYPDIIKPIIETENQYSKGGSILFDIMENCLLGKYVCICEGDDYWTDQYKLQKQVDYLDNHPDCVLVHTGVTYVDKNSCMLGEKHFEDKGVDYKKFIIEKGNPIVAPSVCYRREVDADWRKIREEIPFNLMMSDKPHWIFLATKGNFKYLSDKTTAYRILENSASRTTDPEKALRYSKNGSDINYYFNELLNIGIPKTNIKKYELLHRMIVLLRFSKVIFWKEVFSVVKSMPSMILSFQFWKVIFKRLLYIH